MVTRKEVVEVGKQLGYDDDAIEVVIQRAGSNAIAKRRLETKLASQRRFVERESDKRFANRESERSRARHAKAQAKGRTERQAQRQHMTLPQRLAACLEAAATLPTLSTGSMAGGGISIQKDSSAPPPAGNDVADFYIVRLRALIANMEREVDAELHGADMSAETADERNRRWVRDYEGWLAHEVATFDRSAESAQMVERARRNLGRTSARGYKAPEAVVA